MADEEKEMTDEFAALREEVETLEREKEAFSRELEAKEAATGELEQVSGVTICFAAGCDEQVFMGK